MCLLSLRAGGVGLNLIGGSHLVLLEVAWNPALDAQAMGRIHRAGQTKPCFIYRMVAMGTIEERVLQRQIAKEAVAADALGATESKGVGNLSRDDLADLFIDDAGRRSVIDEDIASGAIPSLVRIPPPPGALAQCLEEGTVRMVFEQRAADA